MSVDWPLRFGAFFAPFHPVGQNPTLALEYDLERVEALDRLGTIDEQQVKIVELRYFGGLSLEETAEALQISRATVARDWNVARAWLHRELTR